ncbi:MAG: DUF2794 domain-containing protein [Alphaproteobacteria bacterium]|nr:DUF2794 domain-containing protein [Alphaproteobacteria bacterium]
MSDSEPIHYLTPRSKGAPSVAVPAPQGSSENRSQGAQQTRFNRQELSQILAVYGRKVAAGEWRDYAIDMGRDKAVFSVFRKSSEWPLLRIEKNPKLARKQGAYSVVAATGLILKRGHDLRRVLDVLDRRVELVR